MTALMIGLYLILLERLRAANQEYFEILELLGFIILIFGMYNELIIFRFTGSDENVKVRESEIN